MRYEQWYEKWPNLGTVSLNQLNLIRKIHKLRRCLAKPTKFDMKSNETSIMSDQTYFIWCENGQTAILSHEINRQVRFSKKSVTKHMCFTVESEVCHTGARTRTLRWRFFIVKRLNFVWPKTKSRRKANVKFRPFEDVRSGMPTYVLSPTLAGRMRLYI